MRQTPLPTGAIAATSRALAAAGYLADESAALVSYLAQRLGKPVLVEGPAGVGKTELAKALSRATGRELIRLQCYEGLDEAKALYEWNYRKQLLRIQAEASPEDAADGAPAVMDDIFAEEFLLTRPLLERDRLAEAGRPADRRDRQDRPGVRGDAARGPLRLPDLDPRARRDRGTTMPIVLLTSNNSRELTEALKRRCLYLWLDYPDAEREIEIVRLHVPELDETLARRLVEVVGMVRELDLKKPPSIAESIDWARALLLLGADQIDAETFRQTMSIIVKHRTDLDLVAERVGMRLAGALPSGAELSPPGTAEDSTPAAIAPQLIAFCEELRAEGVAIGTAEILDAFAALEVVPWTDREDFREALAATLAKSQEDRRIFELVFDRWFFRAAELEALDSGSSEPRASEGVRGDDGERLDLDELREAIRQAIVDGDDGQMRDLARLAVAAFGRRGEGSGVVGVDVQRIRRSLGLTPGRAAAGRRRRRRSRRSTATACAASSSTCAASSSAALIERTGKLPPARPLAELDRALPTSPTQDLAAVHRSVTQLKRRLATLGHEQRGPHARPRRRRAPDDADLAGDGRRAAAAALPAEAPAAARDLRALRRLDLGDLGERLLPQRPARPARLVPEAAQLRLHRADQRGHRGLRARARLPQDQRADQPRRRRRRRLRLHRLRPRLARVPDEISADLDPRSTVIVLGDARTNGRDPHAAAFARIAERAGRTFWLNPEPRLYWNYGDSVMAAYEPLRAPAPSSAGRRSTSRSSST